MKPSTGRNNKLLFEGADWDFATLQRSTTVSTRSRSGELGLDVYPNQIEVISTEQMLDAYSSIGMPLFYKHWSFGNSSCATSDLPQGWQGLAYEIVINSNPCISYIWRKTPPRCRRWYCARRVRAQPLLQKQLRLQTVDGRGRHLDYLAFAKDYIAECEDRYGPAEVERVLDAAHALRVRASIAIPVKKPSTCVRGEARTRTPRA